VKELEELYSKKLALEGDAYLRLEQRGLELKKAFEEKIKDIKLQNEKAIRKLVDEFKVNLLKVQDEMKESQQVSAQLQFFYQNKLAKHQEDHDNEIDDLKIRHEERLAELKESWTRYEQDQKASSQIKQRLEVERNETEKQYLSA